MLNLLAMEMTEPHLRLTSVFIATSMEIASNHALLERSFLVGVTMGCLIIRGILRFHCQLKLACQTLTMFFHFFFWPYIGTNDIQTFIVYAKCALVLHRNGLVIFSVFRLSYHADQRITMPTISPMSPHLKWKISFTGRRIRITIFKKYIILQGKGDSCWKHPKYLF